MKLKICRTSIHSCLSRKVLRTFLSEVLPPQLPFLLLQAELVFGSRDKRRQLSLPAHSNAWWTGAHLLSPLGTINNQPRSEGLPRFLCRPEPRSGRGSLPSGFAHSIHPTLQQARACRKC